MFLAKVFLAYGTLQALAQVVIVIATKKVLFSVLFAPDFD